MGPNNDSQPTIEYAGQDDVAAVADLWVRLAVEQRQYDSYVRAEANRTTMRETLAAHQASDGLLVARADDRIVGFVSVSVEHGSLELDATRGVLSNIYVAPNHRDEGLGTALLEAAESELATRGAEVVILEVMAGNQGARRFYERHGYDPYRVGMERSLEGENDTHSREDG